MGIAYPTDQMTWSELLDLAEKTTTENQYGFAVQNAGNVCYQDFIYSNGGTIVSDDGMSCVINQPDAVEAIQFLHDMMYVQKVSPTYAEQVEMSANDMFISGKVAMISGGSWKIKPFSEALGDNLGICEMPVSETPAITVHGLAYCISAKSEHIDASWQFVKFLASKEAQEATASGAIPAYAGCDQLWADNYAQYDAYKLLKGVNYSGSLGNPWWDKNYPDAKAILTDAMTTIWAEENIDIQTTLDQCAADITAKTQD
jgi:multiple sugar transport system substrate-binding protein